MEFDEELRRLKIKDNESDSNKSDINIGSGSDSESDSEWDTDDEEEINAIKLNLKMKIKLNSQSIIKRILNPLFKHMSSFSDRTYALFFIGFIFGIVSIQRSDCKTFMCRITRFDRKG